MIPFFKSLFTRKPVRPAVRRPAAVRLQLEALETRLTPSATGIQTAVLKTSGELDLFSTQTGTFQALSPAGTISSISAAQTTSGDMVVFAVPQGTDASGNLHTLWEYDSAAGRWSEISTGYFQQVSAATDASGNAVVFGVLGQAAQEGYANSLWEYAGGVWHERASFGLQPLFIIYGQPNSFPPDGVQSVSAVGTAQGEVAFAIGLDQHLYEYTPSGVWSQVSTGSFQQVSAGLDANGQADAFATVGTASSNDVWKFDAGAWTALTGPDVIPPPGVTWYSRIVQPFPTPINYGVTAGLDGEGFAAPIGSVSLTEYSNSNTVTTILQSGDGQSYFAQVSATQTATGEDVVFATMSNGLLLEYVNGGLPLLLTGGVAMTATPL